ncbi:Dynamin [Cynara cardunculus var. scolymus]|uniref:Dynamin n=1 Tax=Cynara cardunculus var. scolymus TaxID=59895 RepID=A0A103XM52_CYNCS|nr:Dynamin [Cynara cardunculus var. scolymus]
MELMIPDCIGEKLPIPEIVALGGQSDGKSSLLEALRFRFNVREVEIGTRRPLILQMVHDPTALDPRCRVQAMKGEPESTPEEILSMVKSLASPLHRILVSLQQSSGEWCSSLWLDAILDIDPTFGRTLIVVSKFDNRLKVDANVLCHLRENINGGYEEESEVTAQLSTMDSKIQEEKSESGMGNWPGVIADIQPANATLRLYGGAAFERVMHEFC